MHRQNELYYLLRQTFNELERSDVNTHQHQNALASIENSQRKASSKACYPLLTNDQKQKVIKLFKSISDPTYPNQ